MMAVIQLPGAVRRFIVAHGRLHLDQYARMFQLFGDICSPAQAELGPIFASCETPAKGEAGYMGITTPNKEFN